MNDTTQEVVEKEEPVFEITSFEIGVMNYEKIMLTIDVIAAQTEDLTIIPDDEKSYDLVKSNRLAIKKLRTTVENRRKDLNKDAQAEITERNAAANKIKAKIEPVESRLKALETNEDNRRAMQEQARIDGIQNKVKLIQAATQDVGRMNSERIKELIQGVQTIEITKADFMEMMPQAESAKITALEELGKALIIAKESEAAELKRVADEKALKEKNAELEKKLEEERLAREAQDKKQAEKDAIAKAEQDKKDEEAATAKAELEAKVEAMEAEEAMRELKAEEELEKKLAENTIPAEAEEEKELRAKADKEIVDMIVDGLNGMEEAEPNPQKEFGPTTLEHMDSMNCPEPEKEKMVFPDFTEELRFLVDECEKASEMTTDHEEQAFYEFAHEAMATALTEIELFQPEPEEEDMDAHDKKNNGPEVNEG